MRTLHLSTQAYGKAFYWGGAKKICPEINFFSLIRMGPETSCKYTLNTLYWKFFHRSGFFSNLRLPWKTECAPKIFTVLNILFNIQDFWASCPCPEKQCALNSLYWIYICIIQDFWSTCACPENRVALKFFTVLKYFFIIQDSSANCAFVLAWKQS